MYTVELKSVGNIDHYENPYAPLPGVPDQTMVCSSIEDCQQCVRDYIDEYDLGGGNWAGGNVYEYLGEQIGYISYNGRYWTKEEWNKINK
jgi:hypothetical protein